MRALELVLLALAGVALLFLAVSAGVQLGVDGAWVAAGQGVSEGAIHPGAGAATTPGAGVPD